MSKPYYFNPNTLRTMIRNMLCILAFGLPLAAAADRIETVARPGTASANSHYVSNKAPLAPQYFIKLPSGSITPAGWAGRQLELQREGLNGHLGEISSWLEKDDNAWLKTGGQYGWEEVPYWLRGYSTMGYLFGDKHILAESRVWIEGILSSQRPDGFFGPETVRKSRRSEKPTVDLWGNMLALWILQNYYEYTGDKRVIDLMTRYFQWQLALPDDKLLEDYWENSRGGDNLWSVIWLYNRTGDKFLLDLAEKIHRNTADWTLSTQLPNWHNVNVAQCFREPATYYLVNKDPGMLRASYNVQSLIRRAFGQVPGGMFGADENARIGFFDPRQGTETCGFVEQIISDNIMLQITGDPAWAENCEDVAFNSFPAAFMPDYKALRYLTCPNMAISDSLNHAPGIDNRGPFLAMNPFSSRCCQHNHGAGWPYYIEHLIMATPDDGLAAAVYSACSAKAKVGAGVEVTLAEEGNYPFEEAVRFRLSTPKAVEFPLYLRIPSWCAGASVSVNGQKAAATLTPGKYVRIERTWKNGDRVELSLPMKLSTRSWAVNKNSVSVDYGPLTLSLRIEEKYEMFDSRGGAIRDSKWQKGADPQKWPAYQILPASPWNYALVTSVTPVLERRPWPADNNPFTVQNSPLVFSAKGRRVPSWTIDRYGLCDVLPYDSDPRADAVEDIKLIPMGAARLRISAFPQAAE